IEMRGNLASENLGTLPRLSKGRRRNVRLVRKVDGRFGQRRDLDEPRPPAFVKLRQHTSGLCQRLPALGFRLGFDEVSKTFDLSEIHLTILKPAPRELARFGKAASIDGRESRQDCRDRRR